VAAAGLALAFSGTYDAAYTGLFASSDPRSVATGWLEDHAPQGTPVAFEELPDGVVNLPYYVSAAGYQPCFLQFHARQLDGSAEYVLLDSYSLEEHPRVSEQAVRHFQAALASDPRYTVVERVHYTPTFLGFRFPIDGSPHDWRYLAHDITVYRRTAGGASDPPNCYPNISSAVAALYPR
jgi:hypothetical protein